MFLTKKVHLTNQLSAEKQTIQKLCSEKEVETLKVIAPLDLEAKKMGRKLVILELQLECTKKLIDLLYGSEKNQLNKQEIFQLINLDYQKTLTTIILGFKEEYRNVYVKVKTHFYEEGKHIKITDENKDCIIKKYNEILDKEMETFKSFSFEVTMDLIKLFNKIDRECQILDNKKPEIEQEIFKSYDSGYCFQQEIVKSHKQEKALELKNYDTSFLGICEQGKAQELKILLESKISRFKLFDKSQSFVDQILDTEHNNRAIHIVCDNNHYECFKILVANKAKTDIPNNKKHLPLHLAVHQNAFEIFRDLTMCPGFDVNAQGEYNRTALHIAGFKGYKEIAQYLIEIGADPSLTDEFGRNPLHNACMQGHDEWVRLVLRLIMERGYHKIIFKFDKDDNEINHNCTPLMMALLFNHRKVVDVFLELGFGLSQVEIKGLANWLSTIKNERELMTIKILIDQLGEKYQRNLNELRYITHDAEEPSICKIEYN